MGVTAAPAVSALCAFLAIAQLAHAQVDYEMQANKDVVEVDFLANYYAQDGNNGAIQGGLGTEELDNLATLVVVNVPRDSNSAIDLSLGADFYSSASTDRIDRVLSTASSSDLRVYANVGYTERELSAGRTYRVGLGVSREYDVTSVSANATVSQEWDRGHNEVSVNVQAYRDAWQLIYPTEFRRLRGEGLLDEDTRLTLGASVSYARIVNARLQLSLSAQVLRSSGLLSTPFHRVYFPGADPYSLTQPPIIPLGDDGRPLVDIERLPDERWRFPVSLRASWTVSDALALRTFTRYYTDSWDVDALTAELEVAYSASESWTVLPYFRVHAQTAAEYYAGFAQHLPAQAFYTSDFDLSALTSYKFGFGMRYAPVFGIGRAKLFRRGVELAQVTARGAYYRRTGDFSAVSFTVGGKFNVR